MRCKIFPSTHLQKGLFCRRRAPTSGIPYTVYSVDMSLFMNPDRSYLAAVEICSSPSDYGTHYEARKVVRQGEDRLNLLAPPLFRKSQAMHQLTAITDT